MINEFLNKVNDVILNPIIVLLFALATLILFWGIFQFIASEATSDERNEGKKKIMWSIFGMFIMFSAYGLIRLILGTFGVSGPGYLPL